MKNASRLLGLLGLDRKRARRLRQIGDAARDTRDWRAAATAYRAYLVLRPGDWPLRVQLGHALKESGDLVGAEAAYREAARLAPDDADVHLQIGHLMKVAGRQDDAREAYERSAGINPDGPAAAELAAIKSRPQAASPELSLGDAARDTRDWLKAARHYRAHLEDSSDDWPIWVQLGNMLKEIGDLSGAEKAYYKAIEFDHTSADTHLQLGHVLKLAGKRDAAIESYRRSFALDENSDAQAELSMLGLTVAEPVSEVRRVSFDVVLQARSARDQYNMDEAAALYRRYLETTETDWETWFEFAKMLRKAGLLAEAYDAAKRAAVISEHSITPILREQASLLLLLGRLDESQAIFMRVIQQTGSAEIFDEARLNIRL